MRSKRLRSLRTDTVPDVIHDAAERPSGRRRSGIVDNSAAGAKPVVQKLSPGRRGPTLKHAIARTVNSVLFGPAICPKTAGTRRAAVTRTALGAPPPGVNVDTRVALAKTLWTASSASGAPGPLKAP